MTLFSANPLIAALDVDSADQAVAIARRLEGKVGGFKVGPRLMVRYGATLSRELAKLAPVFIDNKYLDIPSTMDAAVRASFEAGATLVTVHAWAGREALALLAETEAELSKQRPFKILAVTILTSFKTETLPPPQAASSLSERVEELAQLTFASGLSSVVCSPHEVANLRRMSNGAFLVTPGVRLPGEPMQDQQRVLSPAEAMQNGASALVIGRPLLQAQDPAAKAEEILQSLRKSFRQSIGKGNS